jgi:hypothetical protein
MLVYFLLIITVDTKWYSTVALLNYAFSIAAGTLKSFTSKLGMQS